MDALEIDLRKADEDRYFTALFAPAEKRKALFALYAFHHEIARVAESVRDPMMHAIRLQWWREAVEEIRAGGAVRRHQVAEALAAATRAHNLSTERMLAMIASREEELESEGPPSQAEVAGELLWVLDRAEEHLGPERAERYLRKFYPWYFEGIGASKAVRDELQRTADIGRARELIEAARTPVGAV